MATTMTKLEMLDATARAYEEFTDTATKAKLQTLLDFFAKGKTGRAATSGHPLDILRIKDAANQLTEFDLADGIIRSVSMQRVIDHGINCTGDGPILDLDLSSLILWNQQAITFDPPPEIYPISFVFSAPEAPEVPPEDPPADTPDTEASQPEPVDPAPEDADDDESQPPADEEADDEEPDGERFTIA